ncbi:MULTISPECIES: ATP-binding cassette domain-containing protein [Serratia]|uniref:ATP-binding cassette domain-containing protein n=1 Tax=Serratia TaxID=613 RepID=UPI001E42723D|nr:ATP-binding cassette domain-containing protein [Serratia marcescens]MCW7557463.1 ATP-binding cassette domain-containing protein [Serratia marcescens]MCW7562367.1 ATP-binding cassette domain-containing protein [Serratia marcescens]MCW7567029.1 ATP-binding cassette domain-containing protein [Serratia marcescens]MCW7572369.1 ATP-binding cassette domain-containing protein [Serratia marcescens]MCW7577029.1 ATP-binding cassette domain-containing protein [Serratia marcescens]
MGPHHTVKKIKGKKMEKILFLLKYFNKSSSYTVKRQFYTLILISVIATFLFSVQPVIMAYLINAIEEKEFSLSLSIITLAISYIAIMSMRKLSSALNFILITSLRNNIVINMTDNYFKSLFNLKEVNSHENTGDITQRLNQAIDELTILLRNISHNLLPPLFQLGFSISIILLSGDYLVSSLFLIYFILYLHTKKKFNKKISELYSDFYSTSVKKYSIITDSVKNMEAARVCNTYDFLFNRYKTLLNKIEDKHEALLKTDFKLLLIEALLSIFFFGSSFLLSLYFVISKGITLGHFVMIASYIMLLATPLENIGSMYTAMQKSTASLYTFITSIKPPTTQNSHTTDLQDTAASITLRDVQYSYDKNGTYAIKNMNIEFSHAGFFTLTGPSGAGKSTLAKLISGELEPDAGRIYLNSSEINALSIKQRAEIIFHVAQNDYIFMDTLRFNLQIACPDASDEKLLMALKHAQLNDLPLNNSTSLLDLRIGDNGMTLSGGQRQRLSLARLFLRQPKIIILDEVTSSLDIINEREVLENIKAAYPSSIVINISHRRSTFDYSDEIIVLDQQGIADRGELSSLADRNIYIQSILHKNTLDAAV